MRQLYIHLDGFPEWVRVAALLKKIRLCQGRITTGELQRIAEEVDRDPANPFKIADFDLMTKDVELKNYLNGKLNSKLEMLTAGVDSGFEVFRAVVQEHDPVTVMTEQSMKFAFLTKGQQGHCKDLEATRKIAIELDELRVRYFETTGAQNDPTI